jgi:hypothetical protein
VDEACKSYGMGATPYSGARVSNTWVIYLLPWNNGWKRPLIPNEVDEWNHMSIKVGAPERDLAVEEGFMGYQLVGVVKAHQG